MFEKLKEKAVLKIRCYCENRFIDFTAKCAYELDDKEWTAYYNRVLNAMNDFNKNRETLKRIYAKLDEFQKTIKVIKKE